MKRTSFFSRLVRIAARSFGFSSTGPEVWRRLTPSSLAMMCESVVLPRPGGPNSSTWSIASPRIRAAPMKISSCSRALAWPTYSASPFGRSARSIASSLGDAGAAADDANVARRSPARAGRRANSSVWMLMVHYRTTASPRRQSPRAESLPLRLPPDALAVRRRAGAEERRADARRRGGRAPGQGGGRDLRRLRRRDAALGCRCVRARRRRSAAGVVADTRRMPSRPAANTSTCTATRPVHVHAHERPSRRLRAWTPPTLPPATTHRAPGHRHGGARRRPLCAHRHGRDRRWRRIRCWPAQWSATARSESSSLATEDVVFDAVARWARCSSTARRLFS